MPQKSVIRSLITLRCVADTRALWLAGVCEYNRLAVINGFGAVWGKCEAGGSGELEPICVWRWGPVNGNDPRGLYPCGSTPAVFNGDPDAPAFSTTAYDCSPGTGMMGPSRPHENTGAESDDEKGKTRNCPALPALPGRDSQNEVALVTSLKHMRYTA